MLVVFVVIGLVIACAVVLVVIGIRNPQVQIDRLIEDRLETFSQSSEQLDLEQLEMSQPFTERVILPIARKLGELAIKFTPQNWLNSISRKLELAGSPSNLDPSTYLSMQFFCALGFGAVMILLSIFVLKNMSIGEKFLLTVVSVFVGFFLPQINLSTIISKRQKSIRKAWEFKRAETKKPIRVSQGATCLPNTYKTVWINK